MKKPIFTFCFGLCACFLFAQVPQKFNYQAVARNAQGQLLLNQTIKIRASILNGSATGTSQYRETHSVTTNAQTGLFSISIGGGVVIAGSGAFSAITWGSGTKYLKIEMDPAGGNNFVLVGTSQLLSVPYALYAEKSATDIAIFEERKPHATNIPLPTGSWNKRVLSAVVLPSPNNSVVLDNGNIKFNKTGKYLVTASAPAASVDSHRLCLRKGNGNIEIFGTNEYSPTTATVVTRSFLSGVINVTEVNTLYKLDHYLKEVGSGGLGIDVTLPSPNNGPQDYETYAQITVQKIQ